VLKTPASAPFRGVGAPVGHPRETPSNWQQSILLALLRFSRACVTFSIIPFPSCRAFPRHCQLCSSVRCSSATSGLSATGPRCQRRQAMRTLGRRRGVTVKYENGNGVDYNKAAGRCADGRGCSIRSVARGAPPVSARSYGLLGSFTVGTLRPPPSMPPSITPSKGAASKPVLHAVPGSHWLAPSRLDHGFQQVAYRYERCCRVPLWETRGPAPLGYQRGEKM
jgi:hypothetical protein